MMVFTVCLSSRLGASGIQRAKETTETSNYFTNYYLCSVVMLMLGLYRCGLSGMALDCIVS